MHRDLNTEIKISSAAA